MFLVLGLITAVVGTLTFFFIPDTPIKAKWLSEDEKVALLQHVSENQTGVWSTNLNLKQILDAVCDVQLWLLTLTTILVRTLSSIGSIGTKANLSTDLCIKWCRDHLLRNFDLRLWFLRSYFRPP